jgi:hypothetical protein
MSVFDCITKPIRAHFRHAAEAQAIRDFLKANNDNGYGVRVNDTFVKVRYGGWGAAREIESFYKIQVSRTDPDQTTVLIGYCDAYYERPVGLAPIPVWGDDHIQRELKSPITESPYRENIQLIRSAMKQAL